MELKQKINDVIQVDYQRKLGDVTSVDILERLEVFSED